MACYPKHNSLVHVTQASVFKISINMWCTYVYNNPERKGEQHVMKQCVFVCMVIPTMYKMH